MENSNSVKEAVYLRVYDISDGAASIWSPVLLGKRLEGIWHTGILAYGMEYFYGGGIVKMLPTDVEDGYGIRPIRTHHLGTTTKTQREFEKYLISIQSGFTRECYDLVKWNCNNFTDLASRYLLQKGIPAYILDLPDDLTQTFMGKIIINFIKMFSDAPAIDSDAAHHPRQMLSLPNTHYSKSGRRSSCPNILPPTIADGSKRKPRLLTPLEQASLDVLRSDRRGFASRTAFSRVSAAASGGDIKLGSNTSDTTTSDLGETSASNPAPPVIRQRDRRSSVPTLLFQDIHERTPPKEVAGVACCGNFSGTRSGIDCVTARRVPPRISTLSSARNKVDKQDH